MADSVTITGIEGVPEVGPGADLAALIPQAAERPGLAFPGDVHAAGGVPRGGRRDGFVGANAGVDAANAPEGRLVLLPLDPDASARRIREGIRARAGADIAVIVSDTFGRPRRSALLGPPPGA